MNTITKTFALLLSASVLALSSGCADAPCADETDCDCFVEGAAIDEPDLDEDGYRSCGDEADFEAGPGAETEGSVSWGEPALDTPCSYSGQVLWHCGGPWTK